MVRLHSLSLINGVLGWPPPQLAAAPTSHYPMGASEPLVTREGKAFETHFSQAPQVPVKVL